MEGEVGEFNDWEVLHNSEESVSVNSSDSAENMTNLDWTGDVSSQGIILTNHFSLDPQINFVKTAADADNSEKVDPGPEMRYNTKESSEFCPHTGEDLPDDCKFDVSDNLETQVVIEGDGEFGADGEGLGKFCSDSGGTDAQSANSKIDDFDAKNELVFLENAKNDEDFEGIENFLAESEDLGKFWSDSRGIGPISMEIGDFGHQTEVGIDDSHNSPGGLEHSVEEKGEGSETVGDVNSSSTETVASREVKPFGENEKRSVVWWKVPFEFLKYCGLRVSPVWTFSVAAAVMGFIILGRRLYTMKRKRQRLQLKVAMDDKKVSQFMSRAARLNEAFSVVKRVPVVRSSLPSAPGITPWPVMSSMR